MKVMALLSWAFNGVLVLMLLLCFPSEPTSSQKSAVAPQITIGSKSDASVPPAIVMGAPNVPVKKLTDVTSGDTVRLPYSLALYYQYVGRGSLTAAIATLLVPMRREDALASLKLPDAESNKIRQAIHEASEALMDSMLHNNPALSDDEDKSVISLHIQSGELLAIRSKFENSIASLPADARRAALMIAFDDIRPPEGPISVQAEISLKSARLAIYSNANDKIIMGGSQVKNSTIWNRLVHEDK